MNRSIPIEKMLDDCMIAFAMNGEALRPEQGYPARLVVPVRQYGLWICRLEFGDMPYMAREETSKYTDLMEDGKARMFTWVMDAKSVVTSPCPEKAIMHKGTQLLKGLAWSGRGKITRVDVSLDGGQNWQTAELHGPVLMSLTCFTLPFDWNGEEMFIQSRAIDETGYVQPTIQQLQAERVNSIYHNNSIATWMVNKDAWIMSDLVKIVKRALFASAMIAPAVSATQALADVRPLILALSLQPKKWLAGILMRPDGLGAPIGTGNAFDGEEIYADMLRGLSWGHGEG